MTEEEFKKILESNGKKDKESEKKAEEIVEKAKKINKEIQEEI